MQGLIFIFLPISGISRFFAVKQGKKPAGKRRRFPIHTKGQALAALAASRRFIHFTQMGALRNSEE